MANIVSMEPVLASRALVFANSSYYNPAGVRIASLTAAIGRIGFERLRTTAITFAVEQLHNSKDLQDLRTELQHTWQLSLRTAAMSEVLASRLPGIDSEAAFIAGLLSRVGSLYIFTKHQDFPGLIGDAEARAELIADWEGPIGESVVSKWDFPEEIVATFNPDGDMQQNRRIANLMDVIVSARRALVDTRIVLEPSTELSRLKIELDDFPNIIDLYKVKLETLTNSLA